MIFDSSKQIVKLHSAFCEGLKPPPTLTVSEWAANYRKLSSESSAERGQWRNRPFQAEPMDCLSPSHPCEKVVLMCGSQLFKTESILNFLGFIITHDPGPVLIVEPREEDAKTLSKDRVTPMLRDTPALAGRVADSRSRDSDNSVLHKAFVGGHVTFVGAISPSGLAMRPIRYLCLDEVDRYVKTAGREGSPIRLAIRRTDEFAWNKKILLCSTPTIDGDSEIAAAYEDSDQRKPFVPCPGCGHLQILEWGNLEWPKGRPQECAYRCSGCKELIPQHKKAWMLNEGKWVVQKPGSKTPGFWISQMYSSRKTWASLAAEYEEVYKHPEQLKTFHNTVLAQTWKERGDAPEFKRLYERRERYRIGTVPMGGLFLTAGVDVQADRLEVSVVAWGRHKESWAVDHLVFSSSRTTEQPVWGELTEFLSRTYQHESGLDLHIARCAIDTGFNTQQVYSWVRSQGPSVCIAVKGSDSGAAILGQPRAVDLSAKGKKTRRSVKVWPLNVSMLKEELYGWLRLEKPSDEAIERGERFPYGFCHYPQFDEEYFKQLTAEELVVRSVKGYRVSEWQKTRERNEALDCRNYARAAAAHVGMDRFSARDWATLEASLAPAEKEEHQSVDIGSEVGTVQTAAPVQPVVGTVQSQPQPQRPNGGAPRPYQPIRSNFMRR